MSSLYYAFQYLNFFPFFSLLQLVLEFQVHRILGH